MGLEAFSNGCHPVLIYELNPETYRVLNRVVAEFPHNGQPKNDLLYEIEYPFTKDTVKLKGYVVLSEESVDKTTDSTSDKIVHVFKEIPADEEAYPDYESVPARMLKYTGTGGESRLYPKIRWYEVSYELQKPRRYWVKSTGGLFREYGNAEVVNPLLKAVKSGKYTAEQAENMVMGIVKAGYSLQDIELTLGQPISKTPREPSGQLWVYHGVTVELSAEGKAGGLEGYTVGKQADLKGLQRVKQKLVNPPMVPAHEQTASGKPKIVEVEMTVVEKEIEVEPGVFIWAFAYNGSVPGPIIVAHEGDYIELTLKNDSKNMLVHNIDFHAATGALGGGELTQIAPGEEVVLRWKAVKAGTFIYHCAPGGIMIPWHVVHGMNGAVMILPRDGLKDKAGKQIRYDRAYYIGEQDYYLPKDKNGKYKRYPDATSSMSDDLEVMRGLIPTHVVFGDRMGALTGDNAMKASVGETVLFIHSQANRQSYPHLIGGHGDNVWERGNFSDPPVTGIETWVIAAGSAGAFTYKFRQPGTYVYLSHNLIEAVMLGAISHVKVDGKWDNDLMEQVKKPTAMK
ncbi:hypothetical protein CHS0354_018362 [Potamilus streckersoni]|uniref:Copper-containing nitrite reductase n=1 Tax=Potamilus streckersoni TaxID=2493646 RepID=A0AAE0TB43_9BIVA|nr:hypothetical protein CHS0354_018362 [Potamilus streckersoni]